MGSMFGGSKAPKVTLPAAPVTMPDAVTERSLGDSADDDQDLTEGTKKRGKSSLKINRTTPVSTTGANYGVSSTSGQ